MEAIVSLDTIKRIAYNEKNLLLSDKESEKILYKMEEELKSILFNCPSSLNVSSRKKNKYTHWILEDNIYPKAVSRYLKGKIPDSDIEKLPQIVSDLLVKHILKGKV